MEGKKLGHYEILGLVGKGGMGEVYRARDTKLDRDVAIKVLPREMSGDPERIARFRREARTLATLQHSNVASIYGFEDTAEARFLVMELVEGEDLEARLERGPVPLEEAIDVARQIASGLEAAHEQGIVHRDLKPANIKVSPDGGIKILDFGLARAYIGDSDENIDPAHSPTITAAMTQAGVILGTAAYMSPEQARGKRLDRRADIWAFGVIVFEMLSGARLFAGDTVSDTLAGVLKTDIDLSQLPKNCPDGLRELVVRCLDRNASTRLRDIGEARVVLEQPMTHTKTATPATSNRRSAYVAIGGLVGLVLGAALMQTLAPGGGDPGTEREVRFAIERETENTPRSDLSPDGSRLLYTSGGRLWVREFSSLESREVPQSEGAIVCAWSPDGQWVVYSTTSTLYKSRPDGSSRARLCEVANDMHAWAGSVDWTADGRVVFAAGDGGLMSVSSSGGDPKVLLAPGENETDFHHISVLPGDRGYLFQPHIDLAFDSIHLLAGNERREILRMEGQSINSAAYVQGHLVFTRSPDNPGTWAVPFSLDDLTTTGDPFLVVADGFFPTVSNAGDLAFAPDSTPIVQIVRLDERGIVTGEIGEPIDGASDLRISPDGREGLVVIEEETNGLWIVDLASGGRHRFTFSKPEINTPAWSASGKRIVYTSGLSEAELHQEIRDRDGTQTETVNVRGREPLLTRDERYMLMCVWTEANESNIGYVDLEDPGSSPIMLVESLTAETGPALSPDERFMAYTSVESGRHEIYVLSFPDGDGRWQISSGGGIQPFWSPSGDRLFFSAPGGTMLMVVDVTTDPVRFSSPRIQFQQDSLRNLNITADGDFYALRRLAGVAQGSYAVWLNWRAGGEN